MAVQVGQIVDGYQILQELGRGGNGVVFSARAVNGEHTVAIKFPWKKRLKKDPNVVDSFVHEAKAIARLEHPYIARHFRVGVHPVEDGQIPYLMMELVQGKPAAHLRKTSLHRIVIVMEKVAQAVYHAHKQRVIHCDLKPTNILIDNFGNPKILDFGLARMLVDRVNSNSGVFQGTPLYAAPEQYQGKADERTDIWSLGAILFDLLTGRPPFVAENWEELSSVQNLFASQEMALHLRTPRPSKLNAEVDSELDHICAKTMAKDPQKRYQSADEMAEALKKWIRRRRDELVGRARKQISFARLLPRPFRHGLLDKAYEHLQRALSHDMATVALKDLLLRLFRLQDGWEVALLEMAVPKSWEEWERLRKILAQIINSYNRYLSPMVQAVLGVVSSEELPHQVLLVYRKPLGKSLSQQLGCVSREEVLDIAQALVEVTAQMTGLGLTPALPEVEEIFVRPLKIVPVGWPFRTEKEASAQNLADLLFHALAGSLFVDGAESASQIPERWRGTLLAVLQGRQQFRTLQDFMSAMEYHRDMYQIMASGTLDHTFLWPSGDFCLSHLRIENSGHLKLQGQTTLRFSADTGIECYGHITIQGSWDKDLQQGSVQLVAATPEDGWAGIRLLADNDQGISLHGFVMQGARGKIYAGEKSCGGAIFVQHGKLKIARACFQDNHCQGDGGAIFASGENDRPAELELSETIFSGNTANGNGGAVAAVHVRASYEECNFRNNSSQNCGGAVFMEGEADGKYSEIIFRNIHFIENQAAQGGACQLGMFTRAKLENCLFSKNEALRHQGGAFYIHGRSKNSSQATFNLVCFSENKACEEGGAVYMGGYALVLVEAGEFVRNTSLGNGGAVSGRGQDADSPSKITLRQVSFLHNHSQSDGGAIALGQYTRAIVDDCMIEGNHADNNCGAICFAGDLAGEASKIKLRKVTFKANHCKMDGGAMAACNNTQMIFEECSFVNNFAEGSCGALGLAGKDAQNLSEATFRDVVFNENHAIQDGGAIVLGRHSRSKFESCRWEKNFTEQKTGGAILALGKEGACPTLTEFYDSTFIGNHGAIDGGAINVNIYTQVTMERCAFEENYVAEKNGGAVVLLGKDGACPTRGTFRQVSFSRNRCQISGGALNANDYTRTLFIDCLFEGNQASQKNGGAVLVLGEDGQYPSEARFHKVTFRHNSCKGSGGAVNANVYTITFFEECQFETNNAEENGGGIFIRGLRRLPNKAVVKNCRFSGNVAGKVGADVALKAVKGVTEESLLQENIIEIHGPDFAAEDEEETFVRSDEKIEPQTRRHPTVPRIATEIPKLDTDAEDTEERSRPEPGDRGDKERQ